MAENELQLAEVLDGAYAKVLHEELLKRGKQPLAIDASCVDRIGTLSLQVLMAASAAWRAAGQPLVVTSPSDAFLAALRLLGISAGDLSPAGARS